MSIFWGHIRGAWSPPGCRAAVAVWQSHGDSPSFLLSESERVQSGGWRLAHQGQQQTRHCNTGPPATLGLHRQSNIFNQIRVCLFILCGDIDYIRNRMPAKQPGGPADPRSPCGAGVRLALHFWAFWQCVTASSWSTFVWTVVETKTERNKKECKRHTLLDIVSLNDCDCYADCICDRKCHL